MKPTEEELERRIRRHLRWRGSADEAALLWRGYLAGLLEWGLVDVSVYERLCLLLPDVGRKELVELFLDRPVTSEEEREVDALAAREKRRWPWWPFRGK